MLSLLMFSILIAFILAVVYFCIFQNKYSKFENIYFNPALYSLPGTVGINQKYYSSGYMPYESAVPAIDTLRAGTSGIQPIYYKQYLDKNITPFATRL